MPFYTRQGELPPKRHTTFYKADGGLHREELFSTEGFSHVYSNRYRLHMPTRILNIKKLSTRQYQDWEDWSLRCQLFHSHRHQKDGDFFQSQQLYLRNSGCEIFVARPNAPQEHFYKYIHQHVLLFVHKGSGTLLTEFGNIPYQTGDYLVIPKGVIFQLAFEDQKNNIVFGCLSNAPFRFPKLYLNAQGQFKEDAPMCERDLKLPQLQEAKDEKGEFPVLLISKTDLTQHVWDHHPFDVVCWDGCEYPFAFNIADFAPKVGQIHLPPPVHQVFETRDFVVCNFVPRLFDFHPDAIPAPYFHSNVDSDEVIYYAEGDFMSRKGIEEGSISHHPMGMAHGPQPGKTESSIGMKETQEYAVMIDTFAPLIPQKSIEEIQDPDYWKSWNG